MQGVSESSRAGGFAIQQRGGILVQRIEGGEYQEYPAIDALIGLFADYNTAIGFPASAFYKYMAELLESQYTIAAESKESF